MSPYRNTHLIYNPRAGRLNRHGQRGLERLQNLLRDQGHQLTLHATSGPGSGMKLAQCALAQGADLLLAAGGDGTINEVVNGMAGATQPLGLIPAGTANVVASELGLPRDMLAAARALESWSPVRIGLGHITTASCPGRLFLGMAGIGVDAHIVYHFNPAWKHAFGKWSYWLGGFGQIFRDFREFETLTGGRRLRNGFTLVSRLRNYGGDLHIAPTAHLLQPSFEVVLFEGRSAVRYALYLGAILLGRLPKMRGITILQSGLVEVPSGAEEKVYAQVDGEYVGHLPVRVQFQPDALTLLIPRSYRDAALARTQPQQQST